MAKYHVCHGNAELHSLRDHRAASEGLKRVDGAEMAFAEKDAVVTQFFGAHGALKYLVYVFDAAVNAVKAEFERHGNAFERSNPV